MNSQATLFDTSIRVPAKAGIYQSLVLNMLEKMQHGRLDLVLPNGARLRFGRQDDPEIAAEIRVNRTSFFKRCVLYGDIGFGEGYVEGDWDTDDIRAVISWFILNIENSPGLSGSRAKQFLFNLLGGINRLRHRLRPNSVAISRRNISEHYDLGNEFYRLWLDPTMTYSSALYDEPKESRERTGARQSLEQAQIAKYEALCQKLRLKPSDSVLEIGCGWGGFCCHAARNYGCKITSVTISREQLEFAKRRVQAEGLQNRVEIRMEDYRSVKGLYDKVVSIEMMEALGDAYLETYFEKIHQVLAPDGIVGLQFITVPDSRYEQLKRGVDWIQRHIFPGGLLLSIARVNQAVNRTGDLTLHELQDLGLSYARTLREWRANFNARSQEVLRLGFDPQFLRKWNYYLNYCEAGFEMRNISAVQAVYTRPNNRNL